MKTYTAKLLLFGEYTIIKGTAALAFPLKVYKGSWKYAAKVDNDNLRNWSKYIEKQTDTKGFSFDFDKFNEELSKGLYFQSDIPIGYGVGSSGALCAALYDEFSIPNTKLPINKKSIFKLKSIFQILENFFHGASSGIDPLVCYLEKALLIEGKDAAKIVELKVNKSEKGAIFLIDTKQARQTEPLVNFFLESLKQQDFEQKIETELCMYNERAIEAFLKNNKTILFENLALISKFQFDYFPPMIPKGFEKLWKESLDSEIYSIKLCGAGGGGFILGFTKDWKTTVAELSNYKLIKIQEL